MARFIRWCGTAIALLMASGLILSQAAGAQSHTYTTDADFEAGDLNNVVTDSDALVLDDTTEPFGFIWVAVSTRGTVVKIDTETGDILGEYYSSPSGMGKNPSRTTVDADGNVWLTNRNEGGGVPTGAAGNGYPASYRGMGSIVKIGLLENNQCLDRNGNGVIETSIGQNNMLAWSNAAGADTYGGVSTADDECILLYRRVHGTGTRHVSINTGGDVWVGGLNNREFDLLDSATGEIQRFETSVGYGGYGGLIDANGVIWSARPLLRWDTANPLTGPNGGNWTGYSHDSYGLCIDSQGNIWNTSLGNNQIRKFDPNGNLMGTYGHGDYYAQGCVVDGNDHVWVANSLYRSTVGHLLNDGTFVGNVSVGSGPTGVAVDNNGKIWATNYNSGTVSRIDPDAGPIVAGVHVGAVDFTTVYLNGQPYNYSDMTGSTVLAAPNFGTWTIVYDTGVPDAEWGLIEWTAELNGGLLTVTGAVSDDGVTFGAAQDVTAGGLLDEFQTGQYLKVVVLFSRADDGTSPVLEDLTVTPFLNDPPICEAAFADPGTIWPPNHAMVPVAFGGVTDPDGDDLTYSVLSIMQDEPLDSQGDGSFEPDGDGVGTATPYVRAERSGTKKVGGNGRVYLIGFEADDGNGGTCEAEVSVCVPHSMGKKGGDCLQDDPLYDSTVPGARVSAPRRTLLAAYPNPFNPQTRIEYTLEEAAPVTLAVFDVTGREVARLADGVATAGIHTATFDGTRVPSGVYLARLTSNGRATTIRIVLLK